MSSELMAERKSRLSELIAEFRRLENMEGNEPIRCSRMHFGNWADDLEEIRSDLQRQQEPCPVCRRKFIPLEGDKSVCARCFSDYVEQEAKRRAVASDVELY